MATDLNTLKSNVRANTDLKESAVLLVKGIAEQLDCLTHDPVAIKAMATALIKEAIELGAAVCENTHTHAPVCDAPQPSAHTTAPTHTPPPAHNVPPVLKTPEQEPEPKPYRRK